MAESTPLRDDYSAFTEVEDDYSAFTPVAVEDDYSGFQEVKTATPEDDYSAFKEVSAAAPQATPEQLAQAQAAGLQTLDFLTLPGRLDWQHAAMDNIQRHRDKGDFREANRLERDLFQAKAGDEQFGAGVIAEIDRLNAEADKVSSGIFVSRADTDRANELLARAGGLQSLLSDTSPTTPAGQEASNRFRQKERSTLAFREANSMARTLGSIASAAGLTPLASYIERAGMTPLGLNFQANIGPAIGGAIGAGTMVGSGGTAGFLLPLAGGYMGSRMGGEAQEFVEEKVRTPEEVELRKEALAQAQAEAPTQSKVGQYLTNAPFMGLSLREIGKALTGNRVARENVAAAAGIGAGMQGFIAAAEGQPATPKDIAEGAIVNILFNRPTALGRLMGFKSSDVAAPVYERLPFEGVPPPRDDLSTRGTTSTADVFAGIREPSPVDNLGTLGDPVKPPIHDIVPVIPVGEGKARGVQGDEHQDILNRLKTEDPDAFVTALDTFGEGNYFEDAQGNKITRDQLQEWYGIRSSQELRDLQNRTPKPETPNAVQEQSTDAGVLRPAAGGEEGVGLPEVGRGDTVAQEAPVEAQSKEVTPAEPTVEPAGRALPQPVGGEEATGIRNAVVDENRRVAGLPPREQPLARSFPLIHEEAKAALVDDPEMGRRLVNELTEQIRPLTDAEDAVLTFEQNTREQERNAAVDAVNNAKTPEELEAAQSRLTQADNELFNIYQVGQRAGTANARGLNARRLMQNRDFTLAKMLNETRAIVNDGQPLSKEQTAETTALFKKIEALEARNAELENKQSLHDAQLEYRRLLKQTRAEAQAAGKSKESQTSLFERIRENSRNRIKGRRGKLNVTVDPLNIAGLVDEAIIGATYVAEGVRDFAKWSEKMLGEFGDRIKPQLQALFARAGQLSDDMTKYFKAGTPQTPAEALAAIKPGEKLTQKSVYDLYRAHVNAGTDDFAAATTAVTNDLKKSFPAITERNVMDALSNYGKVITPSKEADKVKLREFQNLARLTSQLEDAQRGLAPLKTGRQRDKATAKVRELQKRVNAAVKAAGFKQSSPEQIATAHDARVTRLKNAIEETELAITNRARPEKGPGVPWTPEELALRDQLTEARERLDDVLGEPESDRLNSVLKAVERAEEKIRTGNLDPSPRKLGPVTKEVSDALAKLKEANKTLASMRKAKRDAENPPKTEDQKKLAALEKRKDELLKKVAAGDTSVKTGKLTAPTKEQAATRAEIDALNKQLAELRKAERPKTPEDKAAFDALVKRLDDAKRRLAAGELGPATTRKSTADTERVTKARTELQDVNRQLRELRNSSEELRLERDKKRIQSQIKELQDRIARNDYTDRPRRDEVLDREKLDAQFELEKVKHEYQKGLIKARRAQRTTPQKVKDAFFESFNLFHQILTSGDLPPVFRQGLFSIGRPITTGKALVEAFKATFSEKQRHRIDTEIQQRRNAPLYSRSKLYLAKDTGQSLTQQEETYMGNWFRQLPRWTVVGPFLRASERSYNTFLNKLRADTFDAMVEAYNVSETDTQTLKRMADIINTMTGRSKLPGSLERAAAGANAVFFSPRFMASRFKLAVGEPLWTGNSKTRRFALEQYGRTLAGAAIIYGLAKTAGAEIELDPRSTDFGKIKFGNTRLDPLGGLLQVTTLLARVISGEKKTGSGELVPLRESMRPLADTDLGAVGEPSDFKGSMGDTLGTFLRTKLAPLPATIVNAATGRDLGGQEVTPASVATGLAVPISYQDIFSTMEDQGVPKGAALWVLSLFGAGLKTYDR